MNTAVINIRVNKNLKTQAQRLAEELGFSLSSLINAYLKQITRTKTVGFSASEDPSRYLIESLKRSEEDIKAGRVSPSFDHAEDAIAWLNNPRKRYAGKV